jgi:hypothetical protein
VTASAKAVGGWARWHGQQMRIVVSAVIVERAKGAVRLEPKGEWPGAGIPGCPGADVESPAHRRALNHQMADARNVVSP